MLALLAGNALLLRKVVPRCRGRTQPYKIGPGALRDILWVDYLGTTAGLAQLGCAVETRSVSAAAYLRAGLLLHIEVAIVPAFVTLPTCLVEDEALREAAKAAVKRPIRKDLFS